MKADLNKSVADRKLHLSKHVTSNRKTQFFILKSLFSNIQVFLTTVVLFDAKKKKKSQLQQLLCQTPESCVSCGTKRGHKKIPPSENNHKYFFLHFGTTKFV